MSWWSTEGATAPSPAGAPADWAPEELAAEASLHEGDAGVAAESDACRQERAAEATLQRELEEAFARGHAAGTAEVEQREGARLAEAAAGLHAAAGAVKAAEARWLKTVEENLAALAVTIARQLVVRELRSDPDAVANLVRSALTQFPVDQPVRIRVNPHDLSLISAVGTGDGTMPIAAGRDVRWVPDATVVVGGCVAEGPERIVDGRVDRALERVYRRLTDD
jgi:flagellar assembly protein FliH